MNYFSLGTIFSIILIIFVTGLLLTDLYAAYHHGKCVIKVKKNKKLTIFWIVMLIIWFILLLSNISFYISYEKNHIIYNVLTDIFWIEFSISNIIKALRSLEIRENGIYKCGYFYKWSKIKSYNWISSNTIQFKANAFLKTHKNIEMTIKEEFKLIVDEVIQKNITL
ncbi:DUF5673 domain-containing protein [Clostridium weizhouense]|uniref:DUF5673 domain-containing protein n=1 Tax=Clostridium weizhouense TaxID=2859781 RepID=UPI00215615C3|nr:DUF5673 domain-containing protein [Clostridium weizhouense]